MDSDLAVLEPEGCDCLFREDCDGFCTALFDRLPNKKSDLDLVTDFIRAQSKVDSLKIPPARSPQKGVRPFPLPVAGSRSARVEPFFNGQSAHGHLLERNGQQCTASPVLPVEPRNAHVWRQIALFLDAQWLASMGARRTTEPAARKGPACGKGPGAAGAVLGVAS